MVLSLQAELADVKQTLARSQRRQSPEHTVEDLRCPLSNLPLLTEVLSYLGGGQHLYVAVSLRFLELL